MFEPDAKTPPSLTHPGAFEAALEFPYEAEHGRAAVPTGAPARERPIAARILWPALGFPAVIAPRAAPEGPPAAQRSVCVLLVSDRPTLTAQEAARHLRVVAWAERGRRRVEQGQPGSFSPAELTVRSDAPQGRLTRAQKDDRADLVVFGGDRYENSIVASLSRAVRTFYATQGLRHLHEIRVSERASARLHDGQYHVLWNGSGDGGPSDELRLLVDHFAVPRRRRLAGDTEAERWWLRLNLGFLVDEYRFDYGALHPPYRAGDPQRRRTEVLHPLFVRRGRAGLRLAHLTDTHVDVRADVYEHNLRRAPLPMSVVGGELRYRGIPVQFNNWNRAFTRQYEHAKRDADAILITGDLIDYGRGHIGLVQDGRYRHELGVDGRYHPDRNWFLFYYLLASGPRYCRPVYTSLGNHDWRLNPYPPFAPGAPDPEALVHNSTDFKGPGRDGWLRDILRHAHGPGHDRRYAYPDIDLRRVVRAAAGYLAGNLDFSGSPLQTTVESVIWYLLLINPFLDYAFALPSGHQVLMLDWGEDEEILNADEPRSWMGFGQRAANSLSPLQRWHATAFVRSRGQAKVVGIHAPLLGPYPDWTDDELREGTKVYRPGQDSRMRRPDTTIVRVPRHTITAIRPNDAPFGISAEHGSIVRERDWFIRGLGTSSSGVRLVLAGHIHRHGLLVAYPPTNDRDSRLLRSATFDEVRGARRGIAAVRREAGRVRAFPAPLYVNTTSAGPRGNLYGAQWRAVPPGWILVTLAADGTIENVSPRQLGAPEAQRPPRPAAARGMSRVAR
jgi:Calcineurin-like phosphoesterase